MILDVASPSIIDDIGGEDVIFVIAGVIILVCIIGIIIYKKLKKGKEDKKWKKLNY